jgi:hypothetical protein
VQETDADLELVSSPVSYIAGVNDVSLQLFERSVPGIDEVISRDLGAALGLEFDRQALYGSGAGTRRRSCSCATKQESR